MKKIMLINAVLPEETRIAIIEKGMLEELYVERLASENIVGNIYSGRIVNIEPSIQAVFVDFGIGRNGFLHISDVDPSYFDGPGLVGDVRSENGLPAPAKSKNPPRESRRESRNERGDVDDRDLDRPSGDERRGQREVRPRDIDDESRAPEIPRAEREDDSARDEEDDRRGRKRRRRGRGRGKDTPRTDQPVIEEADDIIESPPKRGLPDLEDYRLEDDEELHEDPVYPKPAPQRLPVEEEPVAEEDDDFGMGLFEGEADEDEDEPPFEEPEALYRRTGPDDEEEEDFGSGLYGDAGDDDEEPESPAGDDEPMDEPQAREVRYDDEDPYDSFDGGDEEPAVGEADEGESEPIAEGDQNSPEDEPRRGRRRRRRGRRGRRRPEEVAGTESEGALPADQEEPEEDLDAPIAAGDWDRNEVDTHNRGGRPRRDESRRSSRLDDNDDDDRADDRHGRDRMNHDRDSYSDDQGHRSRSRDSDRDRGPRSEGDRGRGRRPSRDRDDRRGGRRPQQQQQRWVDPRRPRERPPIQEIFKRGQEVLVQVIKEGIGNKGPTLTTYVSIPGRSLVAMPGLDRVGVSRKIEDTTERRRLRDIMLDIERPANVGFIVRTAGVDRSADELERDLQYLSRLWEVVVRRIRQHQAPVNAYQESDVIIRTIRDIFNEEIDAIWIDERGAYERAREFMRLVMPDYVDRVRYYDEALPMFNKYHIEEEIVRIQQRTVPLEKGGSIVIEQTEALVAIDVNSGTFRAGEGNAEETAYQMNLAAAKEIARQLRLRDLGGVIVNDFIDMREERHRRSVENTLRDAVARDRAKTKVLRMSAFGMIEMTRQRIRPSLKRHLYRECPMCTGTGHVKTIESMSIDCMRLLIYLGQGGRARSIQMTVDAPVAEFLNNEKRKTLAEIEDRFRVSLNISGRPMTSPEEVEVHCFDAQSREIRIDVDHLMIRGTVERP